MQSGIACSAAGCGTLLHSERCGRPHGGRIDWKIAALDGLGLILFFIPGVIAFVVDFSTGAIYLPEYDQPFPEYMPPPDQPMPTYSEQPSAAAPINQVPSHSVLAPSASHPLSPRRSLAPPAMKRVLVARDELAPQQIEQVVTNHIGRPVSLHNAATRISPLQHLDRFATQCLQHHTRRDFGRPLQTFFDGLQRT